MPTIAFHTLGCKVNAYETEGMRRDVEAVGFSVVSFDTAADVYVVNTCSVTNVADRKSRQMLHRARKKNPSALVVAVGCYVNAAAEKLTQDGAVDMLVDNDNKGRLAGILLERLAADGAGQAGGVAPATAVANKRPDARTRAFVKIQDGCDRFCSYCIIPYLRGRSISRPVEDVVREVEGLAQDGYREVVITGIHISSYGLRFGESSVAPGKSADGEAGGNDVGAVKAPEGAAHATIPEAPEMAGAQDAADIPGGGARIEPQVRGNASGADIPGGGARLLELLRRVQAIPGIARIRLGSLEPNLITPAFAQGLAGLPKLCPHFHLSLQSGCDSVLGRMNRRYTAAGFAEKCALLRGVFDHPAITTDVIVGFPGETEEEFRQTAAFCSETGFYEMHVFQYSRREGTRAAAMTGQVDAATKDRRSGELIALSKVLTRAYEDHWMSEAAADGHMCTGSDYRMSEATTDGRMCTGGGYRLCEATADGCICTSIDYREGKKRECLLEEVVTIDGRDYFTGYTREYVQVAVACDAGQPVGLPINPPCGDNATGAASVGSMVRAPRQTQLIKSDIVTGATDAVQEISASCDTHLQKGDIVTGFICGRLGNGILELAPRFCKYSS
ncbi:MAG: radical SAM protein [Lachnospiraceae bacterium]|jgi:threonylcarbamoyladenosine tRNA methylthiotransferase MtaB|nr:radical SAM protein [Lachnospiraceae bacterium]